MEKSIDNEQMLTATQAATAENLEGVTQEGVSLGKFKDAKSLLEAYNSLQSEFTRRSQKLKALEGELANRQEKADAPCCRDGETDAEAAVADFLSSYPKAEEALPDLKIRAGELTKEGLTRAYIEKLTDEKPDLEDERYLNTYVYKNEKIKEGIIKQYLKEVSRTSPKAVLMGEGGRFVTAPPKRPKSIEEAGALAYELFKEKTKN